MNEPSKMLEAGIAEFNRAAYVEAEGFFRQAVASAKGHEGVEVGSFLCWLGRALLAQDRHLEAVPVLREAILAGLEGDLAADGWGFLADALVGLGRVEEAVAAYQELAKVPAARVRACLALADIHVKVWGQCEQAVGWFRQAMEADPGMAAHHSNMLLTMLYRDTWAPEEVFAAHTAWDQAFGQYPKETHPSAPWTGRRLRVGYVSADFRNHPVARFFDAIARHHDRSKFEVFGYADVAEPDGKTAEFEGLIEHWRSIAALSNADAAQVVRRDGIDILVDLAGHTERNRLRMFARKPAPIQVTYLGYPATTGLASMDFRLVDGITDPPGLTERWHTEELVRLPGCFLCYRPPDDAPAVGGSPCDAGRGVTFVSFNYFTKASDAWVALVARILKGVPGSRCMLKSIFFHDATDFRKWVIARFAKHGIDAQRLLLLATEGEVSGHLARYNEADIALDTFPYNGTTTTCEALWMGVPVVTLAGETHVSRVSASLLTAIGLPELVAATPDEYVRIAVELANQPQRLRALRRGMRERMRPITDGAAFAAKLERAYDGMVVRRQATE